MDILNHNFIRLGLTHAKAPRTARRFPRETRRRFAVPKSKAFTLYTPHRKTLSGKRRKNYSAGGFETASKGKNIE